MIFLVKTVKAKIGEKQHTHIDRQASAERTSPLDLLV